MAPSSDVILERLLSLHPKKIDLSLGRTQALLAKLGDPQKHLPPVIHVAGTNGKGSTVAFLRAMLEAAGKRVHVYTSPHLVRINERYRLGAEGGGKLVDDEALAHLGRRPGHILEGDERVRSGDGQRGGRRRQCRGWIRVVRRTIDG